MANPLDDIPFESQKKFMTEYLDMWPYPPQTLYKVKQCVNALYDGKQQSCEVLEVDCSLIRVVFQVSKVLEPDSFCLLVVFVQDVRLCDSLHVVMFRATNTRSGSTEGPGALST